MTTATVALGDRPCYSCGATLVRDHPGKAIIAAKNQTITVTMNLASVSLKLPCKFCGAANTYSYRLDSV